LDEILEEKLTEVLNKIDPYVESKARMGIFNDILGLWKRSSSNRFREDGPCPNRHCPIPGNQSKQPPEENERFED